LLAETAYLAGVPNREAGMAMQQEDGPAMRLTEHAQTRLRQRGIQLNIVRYLHAEADTFRPVGNKCTALTVSRERIVELQADGTSPAALDLISRHFLVGDSQGVVITVGKLYQGTRGRRYRRGGRRREYGNGRR